jgi:hypothetical protein
MSFLRIVQFNNKQVIKGDKIYCYHKLNIDAKIKLKLAFRIDIPLEPSDRTLHQLYNVRVLPSYQDNMTVMAVIVGKVKSLSKQWRDNGMYNDIACPWDNHNKHLENGLENKL